MTTGVCCFSFTVQLNNFFFKFTQGAVSLDDDGAMNGLTTSGDDLMKAGGSGLGRGGGGGGGLLTAVGGGLDDDGHIHDKLWWGS